MASLTRLFYGLVSGEQYFPPRQAAVSASKRGVYTVTAGSETVTATSAIGDIAPGRTVLLTRTTTGYSITGLTGGAPVKTRRILIDG